MKYRIVMPEDSFIKGTESNIVYVIPVSSNCGEYRIIFPKRLLRGPGNLFSTADFIIKGFEGCSYEAVYIVQQKLKDLITAKLNLRKSKSESMFIYGIVITVIGIINWFTPDPLPFIDEIVLTLGGAAMAYWGSMKRTKEIPAIKDRTALRKQKIDELEIVEDYSISRIFKSICAKSEPDSIETDDLNKIDRIELEALWFVKYLNIPQMINSGETSLNEIREIVSMILEILPVKKLVKLERKKGFLKNIRLKRIMKKNTLYKGFSDDAVTVYCEFYKGVKECFENIGEKL